MRKVFVRHLEHEFGRLLVYVTPVGAGLVYTVLVTVT